MIKVLIVDDKPEFLHALTQYVRAAPEFRVTESDSGARAMKLFDGERFDAVLSDLRMPGIDGLTLLRWCKALDVPPAFVAITAFDTDDIMLEALKTGADGYILKSARPEEIVGALKDAIDGGTALAPTTIARLVERTLGNKPVNSGKPGYDLVDTRILGLVATGRTNSEIAHTLNYAESTVKNRISKIMQKVGARSRVELLLWWQGEALPGESQDL